MNTPLIQRKMRDAKNTVVLVMGMLGMLLLITGEAVYFLEQSF